MEERCTGCEAPASASRFKFDEWNNPWCFWCEGQMPGRRAPVWSRQEYHTPIVLTTEGGGVVRRCESCSKALRHDLPFDDSCLVPNFHTQINAGEGSGLERCHGCKKPIGERHDAWCPYEGWVIEAQGFEPVSDQEMSEVYRSLGVMPSDRPDLDERPEEEDPPW